MKMFEKIGEFFFKWSRRSKITKCDISSTTLVLDLNLSELNYL